MVTFNKIYSSEQEIRYEYFPEGDKTCTAGVIGINLETDNISLIQPAERDLQIVIPASEMNAMRKNIEEMRKECGEEPLTEDELPTVTEDTMYYRYASHALNKISGAYENGKILDSGEVIWY